ncbi:MAG: hypothetical protein K2X43_01065 [Hyphomonadaceae bacterium]|jgi:hypothetical protein|nr:hypothetical protein [Hyphomonadaceae bacterium]
MFNNGPQTLTDEQQLGKMKEDPRLKGIPMDEPIFVLRATDILAPVIVNHWCSIHALNPRMPPSALKAAREIAELMSRWPDRKWAGE